MSLTILSLCFGITLLALLVYRFFAPKESRIHWFSYAAFAFLMLELLLFAISQRYLSGPQLYFLDIRYTEFNHSAAFSATLLFVAAVSAFFVAKKNHWERLFYFGLSICFSFLAVDEYFMIHETLPAWEESYALTALTMAFFGIWIFRHAKHKHGLILYMGLFGGMALAATGSIGMEEFFGKNCFGILSRTDCIDVPLLEELFETLGFIFAASSLLYLARERVSARFIALPSFAWLGLMLFSTWLQPVLESRFLAAPAELSFQETALQLNAYRLNQSTFRAGDTLNLDLYWQKTANDSREFGYTVNFLDPVTGESLWRENLNIAYPATDAWFPGAIYRSHYQAIVPNHIEEPVNAILTVSLWIMENETYHNFLGNSASLPVFAEQFPVVAEISFLSPKATFRPEYRFANGIQLAVPELIQDDNYRLRLTWSSEADIHENYAYFIHFLGQDGQENLIFDSPSFDNRFPSSAWRLGMVETDEIALDLPEDARGSYQLVMGLLNTATNERLAVTDENGNLLPNASIPISEISIP